MQGYRDRFQDYDEDRVVRTPSFQVYLPNKIGAGSNLIVTIEPYLAKCLANLILNNGGDTNPALLAMAHQIESSVDKLKAA